MNRMLARGHVAPVVLMAALLVDAPSLAAQEIPSDAPRRLVLMVQYIGTDYGNAVQDGAVVNQAEYDEAVQNTKDALDSYRQLRPQGQRAAELEKLRELVGSKGPGADVAALVGTLVPALTEELQLTPFPSHTPDLGRGKQLYGQSCAACHGATGGGDGPAAAGLNPPPMAFNTVEWANSLAPFQIFNTVTLGIAGTAMTPFGGALSDEDRWNLAFFVLTMRPAAGAPTLHPDLPVSQLAANSNLELAASLRKKDPSLSADAALAVVDSARRKMPEVLGPAAAMDVLSGAADKAVELAAAGKVDAANDLVASTYFDVVEPTEKELRQTNLDAVMKLEGAITSLRKAIKEGGDVKAAAAEVQRQAGAIKTMVSRPATTESGPPWKVIAPVVAALLAILAGIFLLARRSR